jgi:hypothetical protein
MILLQCKLHDHIASILFGLSDKHKADVRIIIIITRMWIDFHADIGAFGYLWVGLVTTSLALIGNCVFS